MSKLEMLNVALARGIADAEAGRVMPLDEAFRKLSAELGLPRGEHFHRPGQGEAKLSR